jgi:hypothetical protein
MLVARGRLENRQAIISIGVQRFVPQVGAVGPGQSPVIAPIDAYRALLDTGAQRTCLTHRTILEQGLVRHGNRFIKNVHSEALHSLFFVNLGVWCNGVATHLDPVNSYYALPDAVEVINIADNDRFDAIIGMDVLRRFDVCFERSGHFEVRLA